MKLKPLFDRVVLSVEKREEKQTAGSILLPAPSEEKSQIGKIIACGEGGIIDGKDIKMQVGIGNRVLFSKFAGTEIKVDGKEYLVIRQTDILAIIE